MSKIFELKKWLPVDEAADYLSMILNERVKTHDLFRLALDGHLKLSINLLNFAKVKKGNIVSRENAAIRVFTAEELKTFTPKEEWHLITDRSFYKGIHLENYKDNNQFLDLEDQVISIHGIYDLLMVGNEVHNIEHLYQQSTGGVEVTVTCIEGSYLINPEADDVVYELQDRLDSGHFFPAPSLPKDAPLVLRTTEIKEFLIRINPKESEEKTESTRKTRNLLQTLTAIATHEYGYVPSDAKSPIPKEISDILSHQGGLPLLS